MKIMYAIAIKVCGKVQILKKNNVLVALPLTKWWNKPELSRSYLHFKTKHSGHRERKWLGTNFMMV